MKTLGTVPPTPQQLTVIEDESPGYWLIRGAAGSGKTTTALLRLKFLVGYWRDRREDLGLAEPVKVLVLTFNRTLRGYIEELVRDQIADGPDVRVDVTTFSAWAQGLLGRRPVLDHDARTARLAELAGVDFPSWSREFLASEAEYVLGRLPPDDIDCYISIERTGRGASPRVSGATRERLLEQVIRPYRDWKTEAGVIDWTDVAVEAIDARPDLAYDIVVVDEAQDFSANQIRAIVNHLADPFVCTFIRDTTQRIYPNVYTWREVGIGFGSRSRRLTVNYRNTRQIAAFARPLVDGIEVIEDANLPDFTGCDRDGPKPALLTGSYPDQLDWAIGYLRSGRVGSDETVAFLHPKGWFRDLRPRLDRERIPWSSLTKQADWPTGPEQIALSTMHSAKGLEFDHVILIGYDAETVPHGEEPGDSLLETHRRLLAMAVGRARRSVVLGYRPSDTSALVALLDPRTFEAVEL
jgi:superfamily I DNA/RNA helicase